MEPTPKIQGIGPTEITMDTFVSNGSPILGDSNAPITLVGVWRLSMSLLSRDFLIQLRGTL